MIGNNFHEASAYDLPIIFDDARALEPIIYSLQKVIEVGLRVTSEYKKAVHPNVTDEGQGRALCAHPGPELPLIIERLIDANPGAAWP